MKWNGMEWRAQRSEYLNYDDLIFEGHDD